MDPQTTRATKKALSDAKKAEKKALSDAKKASVEEINAQIVRTHVPEVENALTDTMLYAACETKTKVQEWRQAVLNIMQTITDPDEHLKAHMRLTNPMPGTLGLVRGIAFNTIVLERLEKIVATFSTPADYVLVAETDDDEHDTPARPDWTLTHTPSGRRINGMNQVDLWNGGHQNDRAELYVKKQTPTSAYKLLSVIANTTTISDINSKKGKLFVKGFGDDTLCYLGDLERVVRTFFA
jgi:hypothetical protein